VQQRHAIAGSILLTVGLLAGFGCLSLVYVATGGSRYDDAIPALMLITGAVAIATAYRFVLRWPLLLGLLLLYHGVGSWHAYVGHGGYFAHIQDERVMAVVALLSILLGHWHEARLEAGALRRYQGFGSLYLIFGLLYFNLSLWFLTIPRPTLGWVAVFTLAAIAQVVAGARLKDARFTGFGIVFLSIDMYTRYYEHFWDRLSAGAFFLLAGVLAVAIGSALEWQTLRTLRGTSRR
jgi:ABC-type arginine/histidine transport system permease subunit